MFWPCETRTSTCRSFATISSGLYRFLAIAVLLDVKDIPQVGPLQWGWINQSFKMTGILPYTKIRDAGFQVYSEFEEDGIILYVLSMIGFKTRRVVEMCCGAANECMATNLILNHGFDGYLFDGNQERIRAANEFFGRKHDCLLYPPVVTHAWITQRTMSTSCSHRAAAPAKSIYFHSIW